MKKGSAGNRKQGEALSGKTRLGAAKKRMKKVLAKAKKVSLPKNRQRKATARIVRKQTLAAEAPSVSSARELPFSYNQTKLELLVRDPEWAYAWWDFSAETWRWITNLLGEDPATRAKLRIHNLSHRTSYDLDVDLDGKNWYLNLGFSNTEFEAELGLLDSKGRFHRIAQSNRVRTPRNGPSPVIDPYWDPSEFSDITQLSGKGAKPFAGASMFLSSWVRKP